MPLNKKDFIQLYAESAQNEEMSLFLGAGISKSANYPLWGELLQPYAEQLGLKITDTTDLFMLSQYYINKFKDESGFRRKLRTELDKTNYESSLIEKILDLNSQSIWTTNFDNALEENLKQRQIQTNVISDDKNLVNVEQQNRINIYKLNGDIQNQNDIVITKEDIDFYNESHELFLTFLKRELIAKTFLFLGYSFKDNIVLNCLNSVNHYLGGSNTHAHFAIIPKEKDPEYKYFIQDLEKRYHINILEIENKDNLPKILKELNNKIISKNIFFSGVFERLDKEDDLFAQKLCKNLVTELLTYKNKIYTGYGRNFGNYIAGNAIQYLLTNNLKIEKNIVMRPFLATMTSDEQKKHREGLIKECSIAIFMFGQAPKNGGYVNSKGMIEEFEIAKKNEKYIIPVGSTGFSAKIIWDEVKNNITLYPYLERYIDKLNQKDPEETVKTILEIIKEISRSEI